MRFLLFAIDFSYVNYSLSFYTLKQTTILKLIGFSTKNKYKNNLLFFLFLKNILNKKQITLSELKYIIFGTTLCDIKHIKIIKCIIQGLSYILNIPIIKISKLKALALGAWFDLNYPYIISCFKVSKYIYNLGFFEFKNKGSFFCLPFSFFQEIKINIKNFKDIKLYNNFFNFLYTGKGFFCFNRYYIMLNFFNCFLDLERIPESIYIIRLALLKLNVYIC